jgi:hypothetical protein
MHKECAKEALAELAKRYGHYQFLRLVNGALVNTIDAHGDINKQNVGSASRRVSKQCWAHFKAIMYEAIKDDK